MPQLRGLAALAVLLLVASSCGTRVDRAAYEAEKAQGQALVPLDGGSGGGSAVPREGSGGAFEVEDESGSSDSAGGDVGGAAAGGNDESGDASAVGGSSRAARPAIPEVSNEVVGDVIRVGFHVPITGAAPIPTDFMDTLEVIERYLSEEARIHGRRIEFRVEDDGYDAQVGLAACKKLADADPLFVIGHTMPAAQDACADEFAESKIPYFMRGTYPEILEGRPLAWFGTAPDDVQGRLLAQYVLRQLDGREGSSAVVYQNDQTAAKEHFVATIEDGGGDVVVTEQSVPRQSDYGATVQKLKSAGAEFVFLSMPPVDAIKISTQAQGDGYHPTWLGGGTYWNYNMVLESSGAALDGAYTLSPWPTIDSAAADEFKRVYRKYRPDAEPADIGLIMWGWTQLVRSALLEAGPDISRASLVEGLQEFRFAAPYWSPIAYSPTDHRGTESVVVFRADGQAQRWRQVTGYAAEF